MESTARLSYLHIAPRKVRLVADMLKGMDVHRAELVLRNTPKRASGPLEKLLKSAAQNAMSAFNADVSRLYVKKVIVDAGPMMKRMMPRAFGRGATIRKRMSHVSIVLGMRGEADGTTMKRIKKAVKPEVREADWEEVRDKADTTHTTTRATSEKRTKKRSGGFAKKIFTRKVI